MGQLSALRAYKPSVSVIYEQQDVCCSTSSTLSSEKVKQTTNMNRLYDVHDVCMLYEEAIN